MTQPLLFPSHGIQVTLQRTNAASARRGLQPARELWSSNKGSKLALQLCFKQEENSEWQVPMLTDVIKRYSDSRDVKVTHLTLTDNLALFYYESE